MAKFVNTILIALGVFFLSYTWLVYLTDNTTVAAAAAGGICVLFAFVMIKYFPLKTKKYRKAADKKILAALENRLIFDGDARGIFERIYEAKGYGVCKAAENAFAARKSDAGADGEGGALLVCVHFAFNNFSRQNFAEAVKLAKKAKAEKIILFYNKCENLQSVEGFAPCPLELMGIEDARGFLERAGFEMPEAKEARRMPNFVRLAEIALVASRSKFYFWSAVMLCALSLVSYFPVYTLTLATVSLLLAIYAKFNKRFNEKSKGSA